MKTIRVHIFALAVAVILVAAVGIAVGYRLRPNDSVAVAFPVPAASAVQPDRKPLYYQDPDGKPDYSPTPKKTADGRDYKPVYADAGTASTSSATPSTPRPTGKGRILYYRNPMGLPDTSPVPKKDSMGMDYIPVHEGEDESGVVIVSPARMQMLGVKTAPVEIRSNISRTVHATGTVQAPENTLADVTTKFDVVVEKLFVSTTGAPVRAGQPLARVWIDTPDTMMQRGPDVITREIDLVIALQDKDSAAIARASDILRQYGIPASTIADIRRTGEATREITITAPRSGIVLEKPAVEGMRINTGDPLFKIADFSKVWVLADVQERDLGAVHIGQPAQVSFVAFPGRSFAGKVDFLYPTLMANTRTGRARIALPNPDGVLRESMYASVVIDTSAGASSQMLAVPDSAVIDNGTSQVVLIAKGNGRFEPRAVKIGARGDGYAQILNGLKPGEQVVVSANFLIDAESNLRTALQSFTAGQSKPGNGQ